MSKRMTVTSEDDGLYTALKVEAAWKGKPPKDTVAQAARERLEAKEHEQLRAELDDARRDWERKGGREASEFLAEMDAESPA